MVNVRKATIADCNSLSQRLGYGDLLEVYANGCSPETVLHDLVEQAEEVYAGVFDGRVEVIFGVVRAAQLTDTYVSFLLGSDNIKAVAFIRRARDVVAWWAERYPDLVGYVDARNLRSQRWIEMLGFTFGAVLPAGPFGRHMRSFSLLKAA